MADVILNAVEKTFAGELTVKSINLSVKHGEFFSLLGPSGCGKTTTLRMIAGLETPSSGEITIDGKPMNNIPVNRRPTNMVFQKHALFPHLNVSDNIAFGLRLKRLGKKEIQKRVADILSIVALSGSETHLVTRLSGGQQQRVAIARALVNEPKVLLLDEPLAALDLKLQLHLQHELKRIQRATGTTFIYVTHNQSEALNLSDRLAVMNHGEIEQIGTPEEMYLRPTSRFVAEFIGQTNLIHGQTSSDELGYLQVTDGPFSLRTHIPATNPQGTQITLSLRPERIRFSPASDTANQFDGTVIGIEFLGACIFYRVQLLDGRQLQVQTLSGAPLISTGTSIRLGWDADAAVPVRLPSLSIGDAQ